MDLSFLPKLLLQHDSSPQEVLEDVQGALLRALRQRQVSSAVSPSGDGLAVALGQRLVVMHGLLGGTHPGGSAAGSVDFVSAVDAPESLTALVWLAAGGAQAADECILAGTSDGFLQLHSAVSGALLLRQQLHTAAVASAAVRWSGTGSDPEDLSEDVTLCFADAVVRLPAWEVWAAVRWAAGRGGGASWWRGGGGDGPAAAPQHRHQLSFSKFQLPKGAGPRSHALCLGPPSASLHAALTGRADGPRLRILTAGSGPPLAAYEGEEAASQGLLSLVSDLASSTASSLLGAARSYVPGPAAAAGRTLLRGLRRSGSCGALGDGGGLPRGGGGSAPDLAHLGQQAGGARQRGKDRIPGEPASLAAAVWDEKRCILQVAPSPCGRLAACCDSLGRILLVDTQQTLVVRMLKGYREAQVAWLVCSGSGVGLGQPRSLPPRGLQGGSDASLESLGSLGGSAADLAALEQHERQQARQAWQACAGTAEGEQQQQQQQPASPAEVAALQQREREVRRLEGRDEQRHSACRHLLVTYAPRRAAVEVWEPRTLTRLASVRCSVAQGLLLQQPARRASGGSVAAPAAARHACNRCFLLDGASLTLTDLTDTLTAAL